MIGLRIMAYDATTYRYTGYWECVVEPIEGVHDGRWVWYDIA